jgi:hypothetical protein
MAMPCKLRVDGFEGEGHRLLTVQEIISSCAFRDIGIAGRFPGAFDTPVSAGLAGIIDQQTSAESALASRGVGDCVCDRGYLGCAACLSQVGVRRQMCYRDFFPYTFLSRLYGRLNLITLTVW